MRLTPLAIGAVLLGGVFALRIELAVGREAPPVAVGAAPVRAVVRTGTLDTVERVEDRADGAPAVFAAVVDGVVRARRDALAVDVVVDGAVATRGAVDLDSRLMVAAEAVALAVRAFELDADAALCVLVAELVGADADAAVVVVVVGRVFGAEIGLGLYRLVSGAPRFMLPSGSHAEQRCNVVPSLLLCLPPCCSRPTSSTYASVALLVLLRQQTTVLAKPTPF